MIQRDIDVVERPLTAFDEPPEIGRRQRIGNNVGIRIALLLAQIFGIGAGDIDDVTAAQYAGAFVGPIDDDFHISLPWVFGLRGEQGVDGASSGEQVRVLLNVANQLQPQRQSFVFQDRQRQARHAQQ